MLSPADDTCHINKRDFKVPFVCGAKDLGEALRRINEGASMIRTKGEPGTGDVIQAVRHMRRMNRDIRGSRMPTRMSCTKSPRSSLCRMRWCRRSETGRLPVVNFAAGGIATAG